MLTVGGGWSSPPRVGHSALRTPHAARRTPRRPPCPLRSRKSLGSPGMGRTARGVLPNDDRGDHSLMPATDAPIREPEQDRVARWRAEALERAGFASDAAAELAARVDVDLHRAIELLERGCPPDTALRILR